MDSFSCSHCYVFIYLFQTKLPLVPEYAKMQFHMMTLLDVLGKIAWVKYDFLSRGKVTDILIWCARISEQLRCNCVDSALMDLDVCKPDFNKYLLDTIIIRFRLNLYRKTVGNATRTRWNVRYTQHSSSVIRRIPLDFSLNLHNL